MVGEKWGEGLRGAERDRLREGSESRGFGGGAGMPGRELSIFACPGMEVRREGPGGCE